MKQLHYCMEKKKLKQVKKLQKKTFSENSLGSELPLVSINKNHLDENLNIVDLIVLSKLESSKSEIRRLIKGNGIKINNEMISDEKLLITKKLFKEKYIKLSLGKKRHIKIELS